MDFVRGYRGKSNLKVRHRKRKGTVMIPPEQVLMIIKLPNLQVLRITSRSLLLAIFLLAVRSMDSIVRDASSASNLHEEYSGGLTRPGDLIRFESLPVAFKHLQDEGVLRNGDKGLLLSSGIGDLFDNLWFLNAKGIELVIDSDSGRQMVMPNEAFDFVFASCLENTKFINKVVKIDGIVVIPLRNHHQDSSYELLKQSNYKIVYLRQFDSATIVAMRKIHNIANKIQRTRRFCSASNEAKRESLNGLEGVLLEPPIAKWDNGKKINFLSDLMGSFYESYERRIFITDQEDGVVDWFYKNYPTRNRFFEVYELEDENDREREVVVSEWLVKNVREEDYVVMKAEAGVVEEMVKGKTICLVDELFLECNNNQWGDDGKKKKMMKKNRRAYWECVALYGKLRDEGVAVHQWWG